MAAMDYSRVAQFYDAYVKTDDVQFYLHEKDAFQHLVQSQGFEVLNLYGDYSYGPFQADESPFMIWVLEAAEKPYTELHGGETERHREKQSNSL
jgi:hypothetical protein